jgi:23S rRNA pseudouridine2605 synthase
MPQNARKTVRKVALSRALSKLGILSRSQAARAVRAGRVRVNGRVALDPTLLVVPERARIALDDVPQSAARWRTLVLNKPRGVLTTRSDPDGRPTVYDVLGEAGRGLIAVGRLDQATSGLMLFTTDTRLGHWITDPASAVSRLYVVTVRGKITEPELVRLRGDAHAVVVRKASTRESHLLVELREGRNRAVRRLFESVGHEVTRLKRVKLGGLELGSLGPGDWRELSPADVHAAFPGAPVRRGGR